MQLGNGLVDAIVAGQIGVSELAAGGIGGSLWFVSSLLCIGLMAGLSPTLSRLIGQRRKSEVGRVFRQGVWLALCTGFVAFALVLILRIQLHRFPFAPELPELIGDYILGAAFSLPFFALVMAARNVCEATALTRPVLVVTAMGLVINVVVSSGLGLGWFGMPALGLFGIGLATSIVNICTAIVLFSLLTRPRFRRFGLFNRFDKPQWLILKPMCGLSIPIFFGMIFESGLFVATSIQMGVIGVLESGAHQIAISASALCYMMPLGISFALTARVARAAALNSMASVSLRILSGAIVIVTMAGVSAMALVVFRHQIAALYTDDALLQTYAANLLVLGAIFQLSDGAQIMLTGILRGLHDTRVPMLINAFSYWIVAFGLGALSAHQFGFGAHGLWFGLIAGLSVASLLLALRLKWKLGTMSESLEKYPGR